MIALRPEVTAPVIRMYINEAKDAPETSEMVLFCRLLPI